MDANHKQPESLSDEEDDLLNEDDEPSATIAKLSLESECFGQMETDASPDPDLTEGSLEDTIADSSAEGHASAAGGTSIADGSAEGQASASADVVVGVKSPGVARKVVQQTLESLWKIPKKVAGTPIKPGEGSMTSPLTRPSIVAAAPPKEQQPQPQQSVSSKKRERQRERKRSQGQRDAAGGSSTSATPPRESAEKSPAVKKHKVVDAGGSGSSGGQASGGHTTQATAGYAAAAARPLVVGITAGEIGAQLTDTQLDALMGHLLLRIRKEENPPKFNRHYRTRGILHLECADTTSRDWVDINVSKLPKSSEDTNYRLAVEDELGDMITVVGYFDKPLPNSNNVKLIQQQLEKTNSGLSTKGWTRVGMTNTAESIHIRWRIPREALDVIKTRRYELFFGIGRVRFSIWRADLKDSKQ